MANERCQDCGSNEMLKSVTYKNQGKYATWRDGIFCLNCLQERKYKKISIFGIILKKLILFNKQRFDSVHK